MRPHTVPLGDMQGCGMGEVMSADSREFIKSLF